MTLINIFKKLWRKNKLVESYGVTTEDNTPDCLIADDHPVVQIPIKILGGVTDAEIKRGTPLEADTNNKYKAYSSGDNVVVVAKDVLVKANTSTIGLAYAHGVFNRSALVIETFTAALELALQGNGIYLKEVK